MRLKELLSGLEWSTLRVVSEGIFKGRFYTNDEVGVILREEYGFEVKPSTVRNALYRAYNKLKDEQFDFPEGADESELSLRLNQRLAAAFKSLSEDDRDPYMSLDFSQDESRFYEFATHILRNASGEVVRFASRTPILFLPQEVSTEYRREYHKAIMEAIGMEYISGQYVFYLPGTVDTIQTTASEVGVGEVRGYLDSALRKLAFRPVELRYASSQDFNGCILGENEGAVLYKEPETV